MIRRIRLTVAYDGTDFYGWAKQHPPNQEPLRTVQGVLEQALRDFFDAPKLRLVGASRTDSGVHARGQSAIFEVDSPVPIERMAHVISGRLPPDLLVVEAEQVGPKFDVIGAVTHKQYRYRLHHGRMRALFERRFVHHVECRLDPELMREGARRLIGEHDLAGFANCKHGRENTVRTIFDCHIEAPDSYPTVAEDEVHVVIQGSGFLYHTVRIISGTLVEVGRGHIPPEQVTQALVEVKRHLAGPTLPPEGLCLEWVSYDNAPEIPNNS